MGEEEKEPQIRVDAAVVYMKKLSLKQRLEIMSHFCQYCGEIVESCCCTVGMRK